MSYKEPEYSCPALDSAIEGIEKARKIHDDLRKWAHEEIDSLKDSLNEERKDSSQLIDHLRDEIIDLKAEVYRLQEQLNESTHF